MAYGFQKPLFPINLVAKDLSYIEQLAQFVKSAMPTIAKSTEIYQQAQKAGYGNENISGVAQLYL